MRSLGQIEIDRHKKELNIEKQGDLFKYYLNDEFIGVFDPNKMIESRILFRENTLENELSAEAKDKITQFLCEKSMEDIVGREDKRNDDREDVMKRGKNDKKRDDEDEKDKTSEKKEPKKSREVTTPHKTEKRVNTVKDVNIRETVDTDEMVTDMRNLGQVLRDEEGKKDINGKEIDKVGVVDSDEIGNLVNEKGKKHIGNTTRYATVGITKDGEVADLELEQDNADGVNSGRENYQVSQDGEVTKDDVNTRLKVGKGSIGIENEQGEIKIHHSSGKSFGGGETSGNNSLDRELGNSRTGNLTGMRKDVRDLNSDINDGYRNVENIYQEAAKHEEHDCENLEIDDIDGNENTYKHIHDAQEKNVDFRKLAKMWSLRDDSGNYSPEKAKQLYEKAKKNNPGKNSEKIIEMIDEELNGQAQGGRTR